MNISIPVHLNKNNRKVIFINNKEDLNSAFFLEYTEEENIYIVKKGNRNVTVIKNQSDINKISINELIETNLTIIGYSHTENIKAIKKFFFQKN